MILVFCENITPRVEYIVNFMLKDICGFEIKISSDKHEYQSHDDISINYGYEFLKENEIKIEPSLLLFQDTLEKITPVFKKIDNKIYFLFRSQKRDSLVFDPFGAAFYLASRYEEYFPFVPNKFNSFDAPASISYTTGILDRPVINEWAEELRKEVLKLNPEISFSSKKFEPVISIDIDQAYAFKHRGAARNTISLVSNIINFTGQMLAAQLKVILVGQKDPYDSYEYLIQAQRTSGLPFIYFINVGNYSAFDKNLNKGNRFFRKLLNKLKDNAPVGLHPSYYSNEKPFKFSEEKKTLENLINQPVTKSRQHYLKLNLPDTYRNLIKIGIKEDYTMGYASQPGFRAGTCTPFYWFDIKKNSVTSLKVYPITFMEGTFGEDLKMTPQTALSKMNEFIDVVRQHNGYFLCIWHNHSVGDKFFWKGWKAVFEAMIEKLKN